MTSERRGWRSRLRRLRGRCWTSQASSPLTIFAKRSKRPDRLELVDISALVDLCEAPSNRSRSRQRAHPVAAPHRLGTVPQTRSALEHRFLRTCQRAGLPPPAVNVPVSGLEVDALWSHERLVVELDGYAYHRGRAAFERDRRRDAALVLAGYRVVRITHWRLLNVSCRRSPRRFDRFSARGGASCPARASRGTPRPALASATAPPWWPRQLLTPSVVDGDRDREVLDRETGRVEEGDVAIGAAAGCAAGEDIAEPGRRDRGSPCPPRRRRRARLPSMPGPTRHRGGGSVPDGGLDLGLARSVGADQGEMLSGRRSEARITGSAPGVTVTTTS